VEDSGQQFRVSEGDELDVDLRELAEDATELEFDRVLLVSGDGDVKVGTPFVEGAKVVAEIVDPEVKGPKLYVYHWRRRKGSRNRAGHRQGYLRVRVAKIVG
jgi:large subunit ribosomal protein L21